MIIIDINTMIKKETYVNNAMIIDKLTRKSLFSSWRREESVTSSDPPCDGVHDLLLSDLRMAASNGGENSSLISEKLIQG
jgi:hypothetical protein